MRFKDSGNNNKVNMTFLVDILVKPHLPTARRRRRRRRRRRNKGDSARKTDRKSVVRALY